MKKLIFVGMMASLLVSSAYAATTPKKSKKALKKPVVAEEVDMTQASPTYINASQSTGTPNAMAGTMVRPLIGFNFINPKSLNNTLSANNNNNANSTLKIGSATSFGVAVEYPIVNSFYVGLRIEHMSAASDAVKPTANTNMTLQANIAGTPMMLTGTYMMPLAPRWNLGTTVGAGMGFGYKATVDVANSTSAAVPNGTLGYGATPFTGIAAASLNYDITSKIACRVEAGYRMLSTSQMTAMDNYGTGIKEGALLTDATGANVNVDASSFFSGLSLAFSL